MRAAPRSSSAQRHSLTARIHHRAGEFIEHARVHANIYGTSARGARGGGGGKCCLLDIDVQVLHACRFTHRAILLFTFAQFLFLRRAPSS